MTKEQKDLLLKDLCARLTYGVKVLYENKVFNVDYISGIYEEIKLEIPDNYTLDIEEVKPYLFPLDSMTEEQKKEYDKIIYRSIELHHREYSDIVEIDLFDDLQEFYHKNHFDYHGLIEKGLAIDATGQNVY